MMLQFLNELPLLILEEPQSSNPSGRHSKPDSNFSQMQRQL